MVGAIQAPTRWVTRLIPVFLAAGVAFSTYVFAKRICIDFYVNRLGQRDVASGLIALYVVFAFMMLLTYFRVFLTIQFDPGVVPLGPSAVEHKDREKERRKRNGCLKSGGDDLEANRYEAYWPMPIGDADSPGLERFYSKDVFVCDPDGRPRWCSTCCNWKQDRVSHCSEIGRCVRKMDHYCPWVGGIVGETSYKFFVQFTFYTTLYCVIVLAGAALCLKALLRDGEPLDGFLVGQLALAGFFGIFTFSMTATSVRYICVNLTNVEYLKSKTLVYQLALRVPRHTPDGSNYRTITYPIPKPQSFSSATQSPRSSDNMGSSEPVSARDLLAQRTFAIVRTEKGENPFNLGTWRNWRSVMGTNILDWFLPSNKSPCETYENNVSFYEMSPLIQEVRLRFQLPDISGEKEGVELREFRRGDKDLGAQPGR